jgi:hypothetical protein
MSVAEVGEEILGIVSVSKSETVDTAALPWIDGQLDSFDDRYSLVRFTPRRQASKWSEEIVPARN